MRRNRRTGEQFAVVSDLDGVMHCGERIIPGAKRFLSQLQASGRKYLFLTNSPDKSARELHFSLKRLGLDIPETHFYASAQAIAAFVMARKHPKVFLVGSRALSVELK